MTTAPKMVDAADFADIVGNEFVSAVLTQLPWTHHLIILNQSKRAEEREFYLQNTQTSNGDAD